MPAPFRSRRRAPDDGSDVHSRSWSTSATCTGEPRRSPQTSSSHSTSDPDHDAVLASVQASGEVWMAGQTGTVARRSARDERGAARTQPRIRARQLGARDPPAGCATAWVRRRLSGIRRERLACARATAVPMPLIPLIVNFDSGWNVAASAIGPHVAHDSFVAGLSVSSTYVAAAGPATCMHCEPHAARGRHVLRAAHARARERGRLAGGRAPAGGRTPRRAARRQGVLDRALRALDAILLARLAQAQVPSPDVAWAWGILERTHGRRRSGGSVTGRTQPPTICRALQRAGRPSAQTFGRIMRFDRAVSLLAREEPSSRTSRSSAATTTRRT